MSLPRAFMVAAPASGAGKTTVTMGLIAAFRCRGLTVQSFKSGPDYIDAAYHSRLAGRPCINLDCWMTPAAFVKDTFARHAAGADVVIAEGVMGLFDGAASGAGSTAQVAKLLGLPILHVIDAGKSAQSAAAVLYGLERFDADLRSAGAVFNQIAGSGHWNSVFETVHEKCTSSALGYLPKNPDLALPERQLGLLSAHEHGLPADYIDALISCIEEHIDLDALLASAQPVQSIKDESEVPEFTVRLGIAKDEAFCFYYQDNLDLLRQAGIELVPFSPMNDIALPDNLDGLYFGGGFPEEFAVRLAGNRAMLDAVRQFNGKILAECGGLIYLCRSFTGLDGKTCSLTGRVDGSIEMTDRLQSFGYREVLFNRDTLLGPAGITLRGHEFHWSAWKEKPAGYGVLQSGEHEWGYADGQVFASFFHMHFGSNPNAVQHLKAALS